MRTVKRELSTYFIPSSMFAICKTDQVLLNEICKIYPGRKNGPYKLDKFVKYIKDKHSLTMSEYCKTYLDFKWPLCPQTNLETNFKISGAGIEINKTHNTAKITKENPQFKAFCERMSKERSGSGNPMFGKPAWNKNLDISDERVAAMAEKHRGKTVSEESKKKMSDSAKAREIHGHTGCKHSEESRKKMSVGQAKRYESGNFDRKSSIQIEVEKYLQSLNLVEELKNEFRVDWYSIDCAMPNAKIAIEIQGTFFHIDPRIYPNGPTNAVQRRNAGRDKRKREHLEGLGWKIIEVWEIEIRNGQYKEQLLCKLKELNLLKASE